MKNFKKPSLTLIFAVFICLSLAAAGIVSASQQISDNDYVALNVANENGARFVDYSSSAYMYFNGTGGTNALHIASDNNTPYGDITNTTTTSGTFYISDTGGRGWMDDAILMIAVNGSDEDLNDFLINITSSGYHWDPITSGYPDYTGTIANYSSSATSDNYGISDFTGSNGYYSTWKPAPSTNYAIYANQSVNDTSEPFKIIFVDLYSGVIGQNTLKSSGWVSGWNNHQVHDNGTVKVQYNIQGLPSGSIVAFNAYSFCRYSNGDAVKWTNAVNTPGNNSGGTSGYFVRN